MRSDQDREGRFLEVLSDSRGSIDGERKLLQSSEKFSKMYTDIHFFCNTNSEFITRRKILTHHPLELRIRFYFRYFEVMMIWHFYSMELERRQTIVRKWKFLCYPLTIFGSNQIRLSLKNPWNTINLKKCLLEIFSRVESLCQIINNQHRSR